MNTTCKATVSTHDVTRYVDVDVPAAGVTAADQLVARRSRETGPSVRGRSVTDPRSIQLDATGVFIGGRMTNDVSVLGSAPPRGRHR